MAHSECRWTRGCASKTPRSLENTCHTRVLPRWCFTKRCYIKCTYLYLLPLHEWCLFTMMTLSLNFNWPFSRWTWVSWYQNVSILDFIGAKTDGSGGKNWSYKTCKAPVKSSPPTNQHPTFKGRMPLLSPTQQRQSTEGKFYNDDKVNDFYDGWK